MTSKATFLSNLFCVAMGRLMGHFRKTTFSRTGQKGPELIKKNEEQEKRNIKTCGLRAQARWTWSVARPLDNLARSPCTYGTRQQFSKGWDVPSRILEWYRIDSHQRQIIESHTDLYLRHPLASVIAEGVCCDYDYATMQMCWVTLLGISFVDFYKCNFIRLWYETVWVVPLPDNGGKSSFIRERPSKNDFFGGQL